MTFNQVTSRGSDGESTEVILSPNLLPTPVEQPARTMKQIEESLDRHIEEEGLVEQLEE